MPQPFASAGALERRLSAVRQLGQLAYPWGVCVDAPNLAYVVDAGNNRIQIWRLP